MRGSVKRLPKHLVVVGRHPYADATCELVHDMGLLVRVRFDTLTEPCPGGCGCEVPLERLVFREKLAPAQAVLS